MNRRRVNAKANPCNAFGIRGPGGKVLAAVVEAACVSMVLMVVHSQHRCGTAPYHCSLRYGTVWYQVLARVGTALDAAARPFERRGMQLLTSLLMNLTESAGFQNAGLPPLTQPKAVILVGGLRELTALAVEDGHTMREIVEPAVQASVAMLGYR